MIDGMNRWVAGLQGRNMVLLVRWYAARAQMTGQSSDPSQCADTAKVLLIAEEHSTAVADHLIAEFHAAFDRSAQGFRELAFEHGLDGKAPRVVGSEKVADPPIVQTFRWLGQMAYIKGIDGSPWHDSQAVKRLKRESNSMTVKLIRAWEAGYDDAYDNERQLHLERRSILEQPRVYDARHIRVAVPRASDKKD